MNVRPGSVSFDAAFLRARAFLATRTSRAFIEAAYSARYPRTCSARAGSRQGLQYFVPRKQGRQSVKLVPHRPHPISKPCTRPARGRHFLDRRRRPREAHERRSRAQPCAQRGRSGDGALTPGPHLRARVIVTGENAPAHVSDMGAWAPVIPVAVGRYETGGVNRFRSFTHRIASVVASTSGPSPDAREVAGLTLGAQRVCTVAARTHDPGRQAHRPCTRDFARSAQNHERPRNFRGFKSRPPRSVSAVNTGRFSPTAILCAAPCAPTRRISRASTASQSVAHGHVV